MRVTNFNAAVPPLVFIFSFRSSRTAAIALVTAALPDTLSAGLQWESERSHPLTFPRAESSGTSTTGAKRVGLTMRREGEGRS